MNQTNQIVTTEQKIESERTTMENRRSWALTMDDHELKQYFEFSPSRGMIVNKLANGRVFILGADSWVDMVASLRETFGAGTTVFLLKMGRAYGGSVARKLKTYVKSTSVLHKLSASAGFGTFVVRADEEMGTWIRVNVRDCVFCKESEGHCDCSFLAGVMQGAAEEFYDKQYAIIRRKCYQTAGRHSCEVVLSEDQDTLLRKSRKIRGFPDNPLGEEFR
jgi:predicted hydrocarbon binding protein